MPIVSVIVPVYNVENFLSDCISSLVSQTCEDIEIILIDDGSADKSGIICDSWAERDNRIKVAHQENKGQCSARNKGLEMACGKYIMFVDSDDYVSPEICEKLTCVLTAEACDVVRCGYANFSNNNEPESQIKAASNDVTIYSAEEALSNFVYPLTGSDKHFTAMVCAAVYKRELFNDISFPDGYIYEEGFVLPKLFLKCSRLAYVDSTLYYYRVNPNGTISSGLTDKGLKSIDDWREIHFLLKERFPEFNKITCERWANKYLNTYFAIIKSDKIDKDNYFKNYIINELKNNYTYFIEIGIEKELLKKIKYFNNNPGRYLKYMKHFETKIKIINKIKKF